MPPVLLATEFAGRWTDLPVGYLLLWSGLVLVTVLLIVLVVTRWGKLCPVLTCATLSALAHVLLACLATIVRIVTSEGEVAQGPPVRVRLLQDVAVAAPELPTPPEPLTDTPSPTPDLARAEPPHAPAEPLPADNVAPLPTPQEIVDEPAPANPASSISASPPASPITPSPANNPTTTDHQPPVISPQPPATSPPSPDPIPEPAQVASETPPPPSEIPAAVAVPDRVPTARNSATPYANRDRSDRLGFVLQEGGSLETEAAVRAALAWLAAAQSNDGRWNASLHGAGQERAVLGHNRQGAGTRADHGITALAELLAFLGAGHTHQQGEYHATVRDGLEFLIERQATDGNLAGDATFYAQMYCHSMATFALCEALAVSDDRRLEPAVRAALEYTLRAQHPTTGGWRYRSGDTGDTSQLGWHLMSLRSAELAGLELPPDTWDRVEQFLRTVARGEFGGLASYRPDGPAQRTMTAEALYCRELLVDTTGGQIDPRAAAEATLQILGEPPGVAQANLDFWYYGTLALHHRQAHDDASRQAWRQWNDALKRTLLAAQTGYGNDAGSWAPNSVWAGYGGRVYSTALAALCLEVYYRYTPDQDASGPTRWMAAQPDNNRQTR